MTNAQAAAHFAGLPPNEDAITVVVDIDDMSIEESLLMSAEQAFANLDPEEDREPGDAGWTELRQNSSPVSFIRAR